MPQYYGQNTVWGQNKTYHDNQHLARGVLAYQSCTKPISFALLWEKNIFVIFAESTICIAYATKYFMIVKGWRRHIQYRTFVQGLSHGSLPFSLLKFYDTLWPELTMLPYLLIHQWPQLWSALIDALSCIMLRCMLLHAMLPLPRAWLSLEAFTKLRSDVS